MATKFQEVSKGSPTQNSTHVEPRNIVISRTDAIGDVVLTLPLCGLIKKRWPQSRIHFLGRDYTLPVIECSQHIDQAWSVDRIDDLTKWFQEQDIDTAIHVFPNKKVAYAAKKAKVAHRIGTRRRLYHWWTCNYRLNFSRKNSPLHEAQLNSLLLEPLGIFPPSDLNKFSNYYGFRSPPILCPRLESLLDNSRFHLVIHPKSKGSAREWPLSHYHKLIELLPKEKVQVFITGSPAEKELLHKQCPEIFDSAVVTDLAGTMTLTELVAFIANCDGLLAASTGPLHIAAASGTKALGLYPSIRPVHPGRWAPVGAQAGFLAQPKECFSCPASQDCVCLRNLSPGAVLEHMSSWWQI